MTVISSVVFGAKDVKAEVPSCIELSNPRIGDTCYTEVPYNARVENSKNPQSFQIEHVALPGYVIVDTRNIEEGRGGTTNGPSIVVTRPGTAIQILRNYQQASQELNNFSQRIEAEARTSNTDFGGILAIQQRTQEKFSSAINQLTQIQSNSEAIVVSGSAQAVWTTYNLLIGQQTVYEKGGTLRGRIQVYQRYVGTPDQADRILSDAKNQILSLVRQNSANVNPPSNVNPSGQQPSTTPQKDRTTGIIEAIGGIVGTLINGATNQHDQTPSCVSVDSGRGWQRFNFPASVTRIASINGGWSVDSRSYGSVGAMGHSGQDAASLAPYSQYKFDQRFPFVRY